MAIISSKDYSGVANGTLLINASGQTGSAFRRASYSEDTAPGTAVIQSGVVIPGQGGNDTMFYEDPTPLGSADQTVRARKYTGDHGFGQISVFCQRTGGVNTGYAVDWLQGVSWALKKNGAQIATGGASTFHDQTVDIYLDSRETVPGTRRLRLTIRRVSDGFYYNGSTFQSGAVDLIDFSDSTSPITAIGVSGFGARLNTATPISLAQWEIDGTAPSLTPILSGQSGSVTSSTAATITCNTDTLSDGTMHFLRRTGGSAASAATIISTGDSQATSGSNPQSRSVTLIAATANQYVDIAQDGTTGDSNVVTVGPLTTVSTLSAPVGSATGNTTATVGFTTDRAVSAAFPAYFLTLPAADSAPADVAALIANGATVSQTTGGTTPTRALTGLATGTAYRTHFGQTGSNVVSSASYTPSSLSYSGTIGAQGGVQGAAHVWSGPAPSALFSGGIGTKSYSATGLSSSGLTVNSTSGQLQGTYGTPGTYNVAIVGTDQSTAGSEIPQTETSNTFTLTITATGSPPTVSSDPTNLTVADGATASFTASFAGSPIPSLQWQEFIGGAWTAMSGQTSNVLALGVVNIADSGRLFRLGGTNTAGGPVYTSSATLTVTAATVGTITSDVLANWGNDTPIASTTIQFVNIEEVSDADVVLQLVNQVTGTDGRLIITNAAIVPGTDYMLAIRNASGTIRGYKRYTAT
jgi:hypothetical protein